MIYFECSANVTISSNKTLTISKEYEYLTICKESIEPKTT